MNNDKLYKITFLIDTEKIIVHNLTRQEVKFTINYIKDKIGNNTTCLYIANTFLRINEIKLYYINTYTDQEVNITDFVEVKGDAKQ